METDRPCRLRVTLTAPDGKVIEIAPNAETEIQAPQLWWPNTLGAQPLYTVKAEIIQDDAVADSIEKRIGLRTLELIRERDKWGESFHHRVNGVDFFAMGADYIPEDNILSRYSRERTYNLLKQCKDCNFNAIRVWGGGFYPHDSFFDACDEYGLVVFNDLMFACMAVPRSISHDMIREEVRQNLLRIRHHASLAVISGNNEMEEVMIGLDFGDDESDLKDNYLKIFEELIPSVVNSVIPKSTLLHTNRAVPNLSTERV
jgi:beta-mannosidase